MELIDSLETDGGDVPEVEPSPVQILVDLEDIEEAGGHRIVEAIPRPTQLSVDLVDFEQMNDRQIPQATPEPAQLSLNLRVVEVAPVGNAPLVPDDAEAGEDQSVTDDPRVEQSEAQEPSVILLAPTGSQSVATPPRPDISQVQIDDQSSTIRRWIINGFVGDQQAPGIHIQQLEDSKTTLEQLVIQWSTLTWQSSRDLASAIGKLSGLRVCHFLPWAAPYSKLIDATELYMCSNFDGELRVLPARGRSSCGPQSRRS